MTAEERQRIERVLNRLYACGPDCGGAHHVPKIKWTEYDAEISKLGTMSSFDTSDLTRLVIASHDECVRVEVGQGGPFRLKLRLWARKGREGRMWERHPTIEDAIAAYRRNGPVAS